MAMLTLFKYTDWEIIRMILINFAIIAFERVDVIIVIICYLSADELVVKGNCCNLKNDKYCA